MNDIVEEVVKRKPGRPRKNPEKPAPPPPTQDEAVKELVQKKKRTRNDLIQQIEGKVASEDVQKSLKSVMRWYGRPHVKSDDDCEERLINFFTVLAETGELPSVEKMALCLGTTRTSLFEWEHGLHCSPRRTALIKQAKQMLAAMDADLVSQGKIPQVTYIFRAKNFFDMKDQQDITITPNNPIGAEVPEDELRKRIAADVVVDAADIGVEFADK